MKKSHFKETVILVAATLGSVSLISGCFMIGPDYHSPKTHAPDAWQAAAAKDLQSSDAPMHAWWTVFNDNDLNAIIKDVHSNNYSLVTAFGRIKEAAAQYGVARSPLMPEIDANGGYLRKRDSERIRLNGDYRDNPYNLYDAGFSMSWELDLWGRVKRGIESAHATLQTSIEDYRDLLVLLQAEAAATYIGIRTTQQRLLYTKTNVALQQETLKLTKDRFEAEIAGELDVRQAEMNIASTLALVPQLETDLVQRLNQLCFLAGREPGAYAHLLEITNAVPSIASIPALLPAELLRNRPDIRAAERRVASQSALIGVARAELLPMFSLNGFFEWQASTSSDWFDPQARTYGFGPSFRWSIFNYGRVYSQIAVAEARTEQMIAQYEQSVLAAWRESEDALTAYAKEMERKKILADAALAAKRSTELVETLYKNGLTDFQNVLDTQRQLFQQQDQLALSEGSVAANLIAIYKAFGGGWQPAEE